MQEPAQPSLPNKWPGDLSPVKKSEVGGLEDHKMSEPPSHRRKGSDPLGQLPPTVAAALAAGNSLSALYKSDLPLHLAQAYDKNLPFERPKPLVGKGKGMPLPHIPTNNLRGSEMLAIISVQQSNAIVQAAA